MNVAQKTANAKTLRWECSLHIQDHQRGHEMRQVLWEVGGMQIIGHPGHWWVLGLSCELGAPGGSERRATVCLLFDWLPLVATRRIDGRAEIRLVEAV